MTKGRHIEHHPGNEKCKGKGLAPLNLGFTLRKCTTTTTNIYTILSILMQCIFEKYEQHKKIPKNCLAILWHPTYKTASTKMWKFFSENHRIIECFGLKGAFKGHLVQTLCNEQGHLQLDQVSQSPVQHDLEHFQR